MTEQTASAKLAATGRENASELSIGIPVVLSALAEQFLGITLDAQTAMLAAGLLASWGAKIKRRL